MLTRPFSSLLFLFAWLALALAGHAQSRIPLTLDPTASTISKGFIVPSGETLTIGAGATLDASAGTLVGLAPRDTIKAAATYSTSGDTTFTGGDWFHAATLGSGTYARNIILNPTSVVTGQRADLYVESGTGTHNLKIYNSAASGTALFDFTASSTAAARGLAKFINNGSAWIVAGPNVMSYYSTAAASAADETPTSLAGLTAPDRRWCAASLAASADGAGIANWDGLDTGDSDATQATSGNQPTKQTVGAFNVVRFDGTNDYLDFTSLTTAGDDVTVIAVLDVDAASLTGHVVLGDGTEAGQFGIGDFEGNAQGVYFIDDSGSVGIRSEAMTLTSLCVVSCVVTDGDAVWKLNGTVISDDSAASIGAVTFGRIGTEAAATVFLKADVADLMIFDGAIADEAAITAALKTHYGL